LKKISDFDLKIIYRNNFLPYLVIDDFLDDNLANKIYDEITIYDKRNIKKSRDYFFAKNKLEKACISDLGMNSKKLKDYLTSKTYQNFLKNLTGIHNIMVDETFHGGGLHLGGVQSFLDLHTDFNYHPVKKNMKRELNILIYFNKNWKKKYGGQLIIKHKKTGELTKIDPLFNRCVIMQTSNLSLHGYEPINFPKGSYRTSIAAYAYYPFKNKGQNKSTQWFPDKSSILKKLLGKLWPTMVKIKGLLFGSSTSKNK